MNASPNGKNGLGKSNKKIIPKSAKGKQTENEACFMVFIGTKIKTDKLSVPYTFIRMDFHIKYISLQDILLISIFLCIQ